ncbi:protein SON isoform X2 [Ranitomeya variabilis]|uniref:protein SON isoform X2 n=1 Tax=Ranitomeya variabilis TaxID=490064 RepID=UPI0040572E83
MATNIEQIFRSFVVNKFKEIQEENRNSENMDGSHNGELPAPETENAPESSAGATQNEGSSETVTKPEDTEAKPMEIVEPQDPAPEKDSESKDLKTTDLSSDDEVKKDSSKKKSKKHKKHKSKKKKKKKKKERNEKRSKSTSSAEDQENASSEIKSSWKPVISPPGEQDRINILSSQTVENVDALPSLGVQENVDSVKGQPSGPQLDIDSGFFGPKCPNEMQFSVSSNNLPICEVEMAEPSKSLDINCQQNNENVQCTDEQHEKLHTNCETTEALQKEKSLPKPETVHSEGKSVELGESRLNSEGNKDLLKQPDNISSLPLPPQTEPISACLSKSIAKSRSRSKSLTREIRSRSKSSTKVPKKQASSKSLTRQRSRSSSVVRRHRSRSSSAGQRRRSRSKTPIRRRRSRSTTPVRYSKSPIRSWWSKSIRNRQRSVSIERRRRSRTRSIGKRRRSRSRSSEKRRNSRTRSSAKRIRSRSRSANRRKSRSTSRKHKVRSRSASKRKSKSVIRTPSKSSSPSKKRKSKSASPVKRQKSKTASPVRRRRSRSRSPVQKRRSRSVVASKRQRSSSASRRRRSRSTSRRRKSKSPLTSRRRRSRSPSVSRRRRSRSPSVSRRRRSRSTSLSRRRRSRSPSVSRRRRSRSPSVSRRRRSRSPSVSRRRRSRSPSVSRRRRSRSPSVSRRRRSRSPSVSRRRRSRSPSVSRRRRSRSPSVSRRRRSRSTSAFRRRRSRSTSAFRRRRSRSASIRRRSRSTSRRRRSRTGSNTRRPRSISGSGVQRQKSPSHSASKRKSRSTSVSRGDKSTLLSVSGKVQSGSLILKSKSVESEPTLQSKSSAEEEIPGSMSIDEKTLPISESAVEVLGPNESSVENHSVMKLPDVTSVTQSKESSYESKNSSPVVMLMPCNDNSIDMELCPVEQNISSNTAYNEDISIECDMDIEPDSLTPTHIDYIEQSAEIVFIAENSNTFEVERATDHAKVVELRTDEQPEQDTLGIGAEDGTVCKSFGLSLLASSCTVESPEYKASEFCDERSMVVPLTDSVCHTKSNVEGEPEFAYEGSEFACKATTSPNTELSSTDPLPNCIEILQDSESIKYMQNASTDTPVIKYLSQKHTDSDHPNLAEKEDIPELHAEKRVDSSKTCSTSDHITSEAKSCFSPVTCNLELDLDLSYKDEGIKINSLISDESQNVPVLASSSSSISPQICKQIVEDSSSMLNDDFSHEKSTSNLKSPTLDEDVIKQSSLKERLETQFIDYESNSKKISKSEEEVVEARQSKADSQRTELEQIKSRLTAEQSFSNYPKQNSRNDTCTPNETESANAPSCVTDKELVLNDSNLKETGDEKLSHPIKTTVEVKQTLTTVSISEDLGSGFQVEKSKNLPVSSPFGMNLVKSSQLLEDELNVHSLLKGEKVSTAEEEKSTSEIVLRDSSVSPSLDYHEITKSKEPATNSVWPLTDSAKQKLEDQRHEVISNTNSTELDCKDVPKPPLNSMNDGCTKLDADKVLPDHAQFESSDSSQKSNEVICHLEETSSKSREQSSSVLRDEKWSNSDQLNNEEAKLGTQESVSITKTVQRHSSGDLTQLTDSVFSKHHDRECSTKRADDVINLNAVVDHSHEIRVQEGSFQSSTEDKQAELETLDQSSKAKPAYSGFRNIKSLEDPKLSPKPFLHETGKPSVSTVPVQFKFSKTFKTLGISQLCSTSEDSSDVEISKVNISSGILRSANASTSDTSKSSSKASLELSSTQNTVNDGVKSKSSSTVESSCDKSEPPQSDLQSRHLSEKDLSQVDDLQAADDSGSSTKHTFPHIKQRQYRSRSIAKDSRTPSEDRGHASRSRSKSISRRRRSGSKSSSRKKRSQSTSRKKSSHSKSDRKKRSRSRSRGRKRRSQSKSKGKKKRSTSKLSGKRKRSTSKSSERTEGSKSLAKQRSSRSKSITRKKKLSKSPERKGRSRSRSESKRNLHSKTSSTKRSRSKTPNRRRKSHSKSLSSRSRSRSMSAPWKHSKSSLRRKRSHSSSRSVTPRRLSRSRNRRRSFSRSPALRSSSRSRSRWQRSRSRGRWRRSRSLSTSRRRSRSTSRLSSSLSTKKRKSLSPLRRRRSRSQNKQKEKSPVSKLKSTSPPPLLQKKTPLSKPAGFKHSIGLKSLIQKQLSQAKSQGSTGKLPKEQIPLLNIARRTPLPLFSSRAQASMSNLSTVGQMSIPNLAEVPLPSMSAGSHIHMPSVPPAEPLSVSSLAAETQLSVPDMTTANQWHMHDMSGAWSVPDIAAGTQWSMGDLGAGAQWPMSDLTAGSHWPMHDMTVGAQWSMPDLAAGTQWGVPDVATGAQWAVPDLTAGAQWAVPDLTAGSQWAMTNMRAGAQWAVPDLAATAQWTVPDLTAGAHMQRADLAPEAQVPGSDLAPEAQVPGSDLAAEAQVPGSDLAAEAQVPGFDMVTEAQVPPEQDLISEEHNMMPDVAAEALVPVASSTVVPDVAAGIPLPDVTAAAQMPVPDVTAAAQMPVPDVAATVHMPDVATEAQKQMCDFVSTQTYMSLSPEQSVEDLHFGKPVASSEHQTESNACNAFQQQPSLESNVNTSQNLKVEETLSSEQQLPLDCIEKSQSTELKDKTSLGDKDDLHLNQEPVTDLLNNLPQLEPAVDSECHFSSETCRESDVPFASCESSDYTTHSIFVESNATKEMGSDDLLTCDPHDSHSNIFVEPQTIPVQTTSVESQSCPGQTQPNESQSSPNQESLVEPYEDSGQDPLDLTNSKTDNLQIKLYNTSDHTLMEEPYTVLTIASPDSLLQNESSLNSDTTVEMNSHSISNLKEIEACSPNISEKVDLLFPPEHASSPEQTPLVEPFTSPDHPQLVEPYNSPEHPELVEPYNSPLHSLSEKMCTSPEHPQLVEPYASPEFPQLVEPYASPDHQPLDEPYHDTENPQVCQPSRSPVLTEHAGSPTAKPDLCSTSGQTLVSPIVTCPQTNCDIVLLNEPDINTDSPSADDSKGKKDFSQLHEYSSETLVLPKTQEEMVDSDYPQSSKLHTSVSLQEVPCPNLITAYSLESRFSPKETTSEEYSSAENQSEETSIGTHLEHPTSPAQLLTKQPCSSLQTIHEEESFSIIDHKPLNLCTSPNTKLDSACITTNEELLSDHVADERFQSKELYCINEVPQLPKHLSSEQEKLYNLTVQPQENFQSPFIVHTNNQSLNDDQAQIPEYEHPSAEYTNKDDNLHVPVLSDTIVNLHSGDPSCPIIPLPDQDEHETITEPFHSEESKASVCDFPDKLFVTEVDELSDKASPSPDVVLLHETQSYCSSPSKELSDSTNIVSEHYSDSEHSISSEYSVKINQNLDQTDETPSTGVIHSQEIFPDKYVENTLPTENSSFPLDLTCVIQDKLHCLTSTQATDSSVECIKHKPEDNGECITTNNHFTITPPDLLPYDSDQPTDTCTGPSSEPVPFNSQPPPELLPYDSEQPAHSFLSISDYSTEQGSSVFHAPPELLPYDSDQPIDLHNQQPQHTEELLVHDSTTIHPEPNKALPSVDSEESLSNSACLDIHEVPEKCEPCNEAVDPQPNFVKEVSSESPLTEHMSPSETRQEHSVPSPVADCILEYPGSSLSSTDENQSVHQSVENEQPVVQLELGSDSAEDLTFRSEDKTEQISLLKNIPDTSEAQCTSKLMNTSESETSRVLPLMQEDVSLDTTQQSTPQKTLIDADCTQSQPASSNTDPISEVKSRPEHSRSRSRDRKKSRSKSVPKNKRSRSKSVTKKSHSKSLVKSKRSKSRSASTESNRQSPVVKRKESTHVVRKRSSRSASVGSRRRSRSVSVSPRKRSKSSSVGRKSNRRHSRSPSEIHRRSRSPSVPSRRRSQSLTRRRRSPSSPATRKKSSPSPSVMRRRRSVSASRRRRSPSPTASRRRRSPSPTTRRRRSPSVTRRRRSPSPIVTRRRRSPSIVTRRRRSPSPIVTRRRRSPSSTRRKRSRSPSAPRRRRSPSPFTTRRRRSNSPATSRRRRSPSPEFRRKRSPSLSVSHNRHSRSPSVPRKRRSRSTSASRRRRSRSASQRKRSRSVSSPRKKRSKSASKSPTGKQSKSDRSPSPSQSDISRKRKTRSRSSSRDKKTVEKRRKRSSSKDSSKDYYSAKQRRKSRTPPRRKKSRSPVRRASVCKSPVRRRRSRSPIRRKSFSRSPIRRKRSRSRDMSMDSARSPKRLTDLDKAQLLEIAKANAAAMCVKAGVPLPPSLKPVITSTAGVDENTTHRTYGVTIQELTEKCKQIAQSKEDDVIVNKPHDSDEEEEDRPFYNHPFKVSEHKPISFSLLNPSLKPAPKTQVTLTKEFPVSSGSQHRKKESDKVYGEWVPVDKNTEESKDDVFTNTVPSQPVDISSAMNERAVAQTRLTGNPFDIEAAYMLNRAQEQIDAWAQSTSIPGLFTGTTGAQILSPEEISISGPQAWLRKDQFLKAAPVSGGWGALLMRKMGWREGEGLGRNNEGNVDPILLDFKTDRKGLVADGEKASNKPVVPAMKDLSGKHPISALMELCNKKKFSPPEFELVDDTGPEHRKRFLFRVSVNGVLCQPSQPSLTKKLAKATAAAAALQALGALPKENMTSTTNFCSASSTTL